MYACNCPGNISLKSWWYHATSAWCILILRFAASNIHILVTLFSQFVLPCAIKWFCSVSSSYVLVKRQTWSFQSNLRTQFSRIMIHHQYVNNDYVRNESFCEMNQCHHSIVLPDAHGSRASGAGRAFMHAHAILFFHSQICVRHANKLSVTVLSTVLAALAAASPIHSAAASQRSGSARQLNTTLAGVNMAQMCYPVAELCEKTLTRIWDAYKNMYHTACMRWEWPPCSSRDRHDTSRAA